MKKMLLLLALIIAIPLSACGNRGANDTGMTIRPSEFSEETQKVLKIFEDEMVFFDYKADETVKYYAINLWFYKNGEWVKDGGTSCNIDSLENQIAIQFKETEFVIFSINEEGYTKYTYKEMGTDFSNSACIASTQISNPTPIILNEEIPLWIKFGNNNEGNSVCLSDGFRKLDCNAGVAITVTFSDKEVE